MIKSLLIFVRCPVPTYMIEVPAVYCLNSLFYKFTNICCTFNYTCNYQFILETAILGSETIPPIRSRCSSTSYMKFVIYTNNSKVPHQTLFSWSGNNSKVPHQTLFSWSGHETNYLQGMEGWADKAGCNHN